VANCFVKKSQKIPKKELDLGQRLKQEYFKFRIKNLSTRQKLITH